MPVPGLGSGTVDHVLKYTKCPKYILSTSTSQVLIFKNKRVSEYTFIPSTSTLIEISPAYFFVLRSEWTYRAE